MDDLGAIDVPAVVVSIDHQISEGRIIRFQTGIAKDAPAAEFDELLDKLTAATDRQAAKHKLEQFEKQVAENEKLYVLRKEDMVRLDAEAQANWEASNRKAPWTPDKLPANKLQERNNADIFLKRLRDDTIAKRAEIEALTKLVRHADSATDRRQSM